MGMSCDGIEPSAIIRQIEKEIGNTKSMSIILAEDNLKQENFYLSYCVD